MLTIIIGIEDDPFTKTNPVGCDEFIIPKNYKQVVTRISLVPNSEILFSNESKLNQVCPKGRTGISTENTEISVGDICKDDISCTLFEKINDPFKFRAEQCFDTLYVLVVYPPVQSGKTHTMSIQAEYVDEEPCYTVAGGVHEVVNTDTQCGEKQADTCEATIRCSLVSCQYQDGSDKIEDVCLPRVTSKTYRESFCMISGLVLSDYGELAIDEYSPWIVIAIVSISILV
jgi:hypothetical protein